MASVCLPDFTVKEVLPLLSSFYNGGTLFNVTEVTATLEIIKLLQADKCSSYNFHPAKGSDLNYVPKMRHYSSAADSETKGQRVVQFTTDILESSGDSPPMLIPEEEMTPESPNVTAVEQSSTASRGATFGLDIEEVNDPSYEPVESEDSDIEILGEVTQGRSTAVAEASLTAAYDSPHDYDDDGYAFSPSSLDLANNLIVRADGAERNDAKDDDEVEQRDPLGKQNSILRLVLCMHISYNVFVSFRTGLSPVR